VAPGSRTPLHLPGIKAEPRTARYGVFCRLHETLRPYNPETQKPAGWRLRLTRPADHAAPPGNSSRTYSPSLKLSHLSHADSTFGLFLVIVSYLDV